MRKLGAVWMGVSVALFLGASHAWSSEDLIRQFTDEGRVLANRIVSQVRGELLKELERSGPIRAISVCKYSVPEITSNISRASGMRVVRVSLRPRNPSMGDPDVWEQNALLGFEKRASKGENVEGMELVELVQEPAGKALRYIKAVPMTGPCLVCHGPVSQISEVVRAKLATEYPKDLGVEYQVGQVRGGVSVKKSLRD